MFRLIQGLANCDERFFRGWILARAELNIAANATKFTNEVLLQKKSKTVMMVSGFADEGELVQSLKVLLLLPSKNLAKSPKATNNIIEGNVLCRHKFSLQEISDYILLSGDENIIHQTQNPIVPGLCMVYFLARMLHRYFLHWQVDFVVPVYAGDEVVFTHKDDFILAYVGKVLVFKIKIL